MRDGEEQQINQQQDEKQLCFSITIQIQVNVNNKLPHRCFGDNNYVVHKSLA